MTQITFSNSTATASTQDISNFTTGSITCNANSLYLATVFSNSNPAPPAHNLTGAGMTWVAIDSQTDGTATPPARLTLFRAQSASPGAGAPLAADTAGSNQSGFLIILNEVTNVDTSGTNGSGAIVQSAKAFSTSTTIFSVGLASAFADPVNNACYATTVAHQVAVSISAAPDMTNVGGTPAYATPSARGQAEYRLGGTPSAASWTYNSAARGAGIVVELKFNASGSGVAQQSTSIRNAMYRRRRRS